ncbi:MAG: hypothetical protein AAF399_05090 [Bacteroidota bacterium]
MKTTVSLFLTLPVLLLFLASTGCKGSKVASKAFSPAGTWVYSITGTPEGDFEGEMVLESDGSGYTGKLNSSQGSIDLKDVQVDGPSLSTSFNTFGYDADMEGAFEGDNFKGTVSIAGYSFPVLMTRKK